MSQVMTTTRTQEEYEDDFEKDLDWLISEEGKSEGQDTDYEDLEAKIDKELEEEECGKKVVKKSQKEKASSESEQPEEERWPSPMEPLEFDSDRDSPYKGGSPVAPPPPALEDELDEEKKYILEKIQLANQRLKDQEAPDMTRRRRLHFKDTLVDLVVPPVEYEKNTSVNHSSGLVEQVNHSSGLVEQVNHSPANGKEMEVDRDVSERLSDLKISQQEGGGAWGGQGTKPETRAVNRSLEVGHEREGRVLVEKDGKFDLVCVKEVEGQSLMLPPLASLPCDNTRSPPRPGDRSPSYTPTSSPLRPIPNTLSLGDKQLRSPRPPAKPRIRPSSAGQRGSGRRVAKRRVQSANSTPSRQSTFSLSPQQKGLLNKIQERRERLAREDEQRKRDEEEQKRQENELAFHAWLGRKTEQRQEDRRIHRAQEMERMNCREHSDPDKAFKSWLQRKHEQQQRDRQLEEMKRLEEESGFYLRHREECERAFKLWLKKKREEKRMEQQAARERSRRLVFEERRSRRIQDLMFSINEAKTFRFNEHLAYRF
ncbi:coiled-coil domain-containing protein 181 isoform X2 [Esox lucius]|uniref:coiled-coil domain-containing protein 181 isoform X2 n=1 Tax=Esox lucius TaxID=8010 RepID=UPI0014775DED|nr:coiled-coil domain-containing protein 181 isoform X2 [Esox lucius]